MNTAFKFIAAAAVLLAAVSHAQAQTAFDVTDKIFEEYRLDAHIPGLVYAGGDVLALNFLLDCTAEN